MSETTDTKVEVTVIPDGPLKLSNATKLKYCGQPLEVDGDVYLCRCGESQNAPFCDGNHSNIDFKGQSEAQKTKDIRVWEGKSLRTYFNPNACMHVLFCKPLKALRERELSGDTEAATEIMRIVGTCPSGALTYEIKEACEEPVAQTFDASVDIIEGGEIRLQCDFEINASLHERQHKARATLCRCGLSNNKPWCDGRHKRKEGFR